MSSGAVIVGASHAGVHVAASLRDRGYDAPVTILDEQPQHPYHRPPLTKDYLRRGEHARPQPLRSAEWFDANHIRLVLGDRVVEVNLGTHSLSTDSGRSFGFEHLILATGAAARALPVPGAGLPGVSVVRTLTDARELRTRMSAGGTVVVVGGGFIGLEAAAAMRQQGLSVTVVEAAGRLMTRSASPALSEHLRCVHEAQGVTFFLGAAVASVEGTPAGVEAVLLSDGTRLPADIVVAGVGIEPRVALARQIGVEIDDGVVVDDRARTSAPDVFAVGDLTVCRHPLDPSVRVRFESVQNAVEQAAVAAATICGEPARQALTVPWFWSDQYDNKIQLVGAAARHDTTVLRGDPTSGRFSVLLYSDDRLVGAECVNRPADFVALRRALMTGTSLPTDRVADPGLPLKALITA